MYRINAAIWYNKKCKLNGITPNYINIKVNGNNKQSQRTKEKCIKLVLIKPIYDDAWKHNNQIRRLYRSTNLGVLFPAFN